MSKLPTGTITFLFTDIEGSTRLLQTLRDEYADALAEHRAILRNAFAQWNGVEVDTQGDSFFVAFERARDAVNAVVAAQRALSAQKFPHDAAIRVRMGLHTGEPQVSDAHYVGMDVHRAARIMSAAHGGQVLLSQTTFDLIESELPDGVSLRDLGEHRLKDLRRPKHLYQLVIAGLQNDFPPLKSLDALPNNLPIQLTSFVGRDQEISALETILAQQRLVILSGVGGTGKTRLALQVAADVLEEYQDGVWLIELAPLSNPALVPQTVATALGLREQTGRAFIEMLQDYLRNKHLLLVLDNCEHLIEACAELADTLLHAAPHLKILATSREALGIAGETSFPVRSLSLPDTKHLQIENFSQYDAVHLFIDRAVSVQPNFQVTNENAPAVAQICARLDGIPLAIELAAARVKGLSVEQIAARLDDRFRLLTGGSRTALPRQRTLQAAIDWSYKLLSEQERVLLRRLSVFAGGWTVEAAEAVCSDDERRPTNDESEIRPSTFVLRPDDILDLLLRLVDKSLVVAETETSEPRYHMLETIRQYAQEKLDESSEVGRVRGQHLEFFLNLAEEADPKLEGPEEVMWADCLEREHDNLRAALEWSFTQNDAEKSLRLAGSLGEFWDRRGYEHEGWEWHSRALAREGASVRSLARAKALHGIGWFDLGLGAKAYFQESLEISQELGHIHGVGIALQGLAFVAFGVGDLAQARAACEESIAIFRKLGDKVNLAGSLRFWMNMATNPEEYAAARNALKESVRLNREVGTIKGLGISYSGLAQLALREGDYPQARAFLEQALSIRQKAVDKLGVAYVSRMLGDAAHGEGDFDEAQRFYQRSLEIWYERVQTTDCAVALALLARTALAKGQMAHAVRLLAAASVIIKSTKLDTFHEEAARYESTLEQVRGQVDRATFVRAWEEGRALTLEQAIELAMTNR